MPVDGHLQGTTDATGATTSWSYDVDGRATATDARGGVVSFGYDAAGDLVRLGDRLANPTTFTRDEWTSVSSRSRPRSPGRHARHLRQGNIAQRKHRRGQSSAYAYDARKADPTRSTAPLWCSAHYDALDQLTGVGRPDGDVRRAYTDWQRRDNDCARNSRPGPLRRARSAHVVAGRLRNRQRPPRRRRPCDVADASHDNSLDDLSTWRATRAASRSATGSCSARRGTLRASSPRSTGLALAARSAG